MFFAQTSSICLVDDNFIAVILWFYAELGGFCGIWRLNFGGSSEKFVGSVHWMGAPDSSLLDLIDKVRSWGSWSRTELSSLSTPVFSMANNSCSGCELKFSELCHKYSCQGCRRLLCGSCVRTNGSLVIIATSNGNKDVDHVEKVIKACKFCSKSSKKHIGKVYPSESPHASPEPPSPLGSGKIWGHEDAKMVDEDYVPRCCEFRDHSFSPHKMDRGRLKSFDGHPSQTSLHHSPNQSDEEPEESGRNYFSTLSDYYHDSSDIDTSSVSFRHESYSFKSVGSSALDSPSGFNINTPRAGPPVQQPSPNPQNSSPPSQGRMAILRRPDRGNGNPDIADSQSGEMTVSARQDEKFMKPLDFDNHHIWLPPPPDDQDDETESNFFQYEDDDDDDEHHANVVGHSTGGFSSCSSPSNLFPRMEKQNEEQREPLKCMIRGHFTALVSQLLLGEGIKFGIDNGTQDWLSIVSTLAWQAASFVKPDTSKGGSMDPGDYVKIKCVASGSPNESTLIKGVVCTKNIKHKRMTSQYKNPRLLLLGGSLEYQRAQNQLASFNTLLEEEMNHLKMIVSNIEAHRTNVLLVEKSVSSYAQDYLLAKEISLVLNVKRPLLERIARCTGALIIPSVDKIPMARVGQCELFRLERVSEELETANQSNKKPSKTLMYFEGCPRRLGCTVVLKGSCREELQKIKHVIPYAVFAAYHLSLETSFLADEGAHLPKMTLRQSESVSDSLANAMSTPHIPDAVSLAQELVDVVVPGQGAVVNMDAAASETAPEKSSFAEALPVDARNEDMASHVCRDGSICDAAGEPTSPVPRSFSVECTSTVANPMQSEMPETGNPVKGQPREMDKVEENGIASDYFAAAESQRSILVSFSSHCVSKGALCERSRLVRIRFYGSFDKPLGKYLHDDLFDQASLCRSCKEPMEEHVQCYTHRQGSLTINVRRVDDVKLPGERDGKIWMWHRCLRCAQIDGVPPATRRVIMSDAAWGLSFGKFLELSFSNHATANRVATCGHSLQRDCLRFYGFGSMVAFFHYSPIDILTVHLPPSVLEFNGYSKQDWIRREVKELKGKVENLYAEISNVLHVMEQKSSSLGHGSLHPSDLHRHILELKYLLDKEIEDYYGSLERADEENSHFKRTMGILDLNRVSRSLLVASRAWDRRLYSLDSLLNSKSLTFNASEDIGSHSSLKGLKNYPIKDSKSGIDQEENGWDHPDPHISEDSYTDSCQVSQQDVHGDGEIAVSDKSSGSAQSPASNLSDKIDLAWTGTDAESSQASPVSQVNHPLDNLPLKRLMTPARVYSFDSAMRIHEKLYRASHLSAVRSFHASGDYRNMIRDPTPNVVRTYSQIAPCDTHFTPSFISSASHLGEGPRLLLPQAGLSDLVVAVYDDEPTSVISYALSSKEYDEWISEKLSQHDGSWVGKDINREDSTASTFLSWQSLGSLDLDYINYGSYGSEDATSRSMLFGDPKKSPHLQISFDDDSSCAGGKAKFSVTCYFAKQFDMLLKKCCPSKVDFVCSLSRCRRWSAQGGKSNVYFAKSMDERFIIKQVTKTELESFQEFAPQYFKYLNDSLDSGSPTCLAKIFGIFQVTIKGARETKMDLMVMENLFFKRNISRVYDLKGSLRSRYNPDTTGANKVLLDMNLLETLRTSPIFLGSKAKRRLERAVWNDTSFLASIYVMDYSLLVGVDEERKELVLGIIDFMRQYTWDKHLETWVKASGILGGPMNASPTIISPKQYKRRFRKAMTTYFLTVPDQWSS